MTRPYTAGADHAAIGNIRYPRARGARHRDPAEPDGDRRAALNQVLEPSGVQVDAYEYTLLYGPVLARLLLDRAPITDAFIDAVVAQWLSALRCTDAVPHSDPEPQVPTDSPPGEQS